MSKKRYTDNEVRSAVAILQKWRDDDRGTPFPAGAVPVALWALEQCDPSLKSEQSLKLVEGA